MNRIISLVSPSIPYKFRNPFQYLTLPALLSLVLVLQIMGMAALLVYLMLHEHFQNLLTRFLIGLSILMLSTGIGLGGLITRQIMTQLQFNRRQRRKQLAEIPQPHYSRQFEWELQTARAFEQKQELQQLKSNLASIISHDFRTPLGCIQGYAELLRSDLHLTPEMRDQYFDRIDQIAEHLLNLMDQILLLGKAEAGKLEFEPTVFNLKEFCQDLIKTLQFYDKNQHSLLLNFYVGNYGGNLEQIKLDQTLLWQILNNLLANAIKYSPIHSSIELKIYCQNNTIIFQVKDQGIGIPSESKSQIFETFYRSSNVRDIKGSGLGLAIVKTCVEAHQGQIQLTSEVDRGTTVTVSLPLDD